MAGEREALRDWHRLFGLLLTDFFSDSPFAVEVERDLSVQQQLLDVVIVRRGRGRFAGRLPDGLEGLRAHNLITFKSHREALDDWAMKELIGHFVAYRKFVSPSPGDLLAEDQFGMYAVAARFPQGLSAQVPWERVQAGVYDCRWGTDRIRVVVAGELPREEQNAPPHLFSAQPGLIEFGGRTYRRRSEKTSTLLVELFHGLQAEGVTMAFTMEDFERQFVKKRIANLSEKDLQEALQSLPPETRLAGMSPETRLAGLSAEQIQQYLDRLPPKPRRKK